MHKVKNFILVGLFLLVTAGMGVSVYFSIQGETDHDYVVETNAFFAPFEFYENRQIVGVDVDIVNRVAEKMNKKIQIKNVEFDVIIDNVEAGRIADAGAAGLTITPAREEKVDFTIPYYDSVQYVIFDRCIMNYALSSVKSSAVEEKLSDSKSTAREETVLVLDYGKLYL